MIDRDLPVRSNAPAREGGLLRRRSLRLAAALVLAAAVVGPACGKKGPPLAPLVKVPVVPQDVAARRAGTVAYLQFRIPEANSDNTRPADIERVEVYGFTGPAPTPADVVRYATLVTAIPVRRPLEEGDDAPRAASGKTPPPPSMANGFDQGNLLTVAETLGAAQATPMEIPRRGKQPPVFTDPWQPLLQVARKSGDARLYFAVGVNHKGQRGSFTAPQPVPLGPAPSAPLGVNASYDASGVTVSWTPPPDMPRPIQPPAAEGELASTPRGLRALVGGYHVYDAPREPAAGSVPGQGAHASPSVVEATAVAKPLNDKLLETPTFTDPHVEYGKERCFVVRTVLQAGGEVTESASSSAACVTPADTFPPAAPTGLAAVGSEGAISLIWEASTEADLAGYLVMRAEAGGAPRPLTPEPIKETTFRDATAARGVRYVYTVVAVDTTGNRSTPSNAVEETAR